jgi:hypothetical protein
MVFKSRFSRIVIYLETQILQFFGMFASVFKTVEYDPDSSSGKRLDFVINIYNPSVVRRMGDIESHNMKEG